MPNWYLGRTEQLYLLEEASFGTAPTLLATSAFRHLSRKLSFNPRNLAKSPERHTTPGQRVLLTRRQSASFEVKANWYPSGVLNTVPESDLVLKNALGNIATNITLSTTFSGTPTTTGGTIGSATGLAVGQPVQITIAAGQFAGVYIRWLTTAGTSPVWAPALPAAPLSGDSLKGCVGYAPGTSLPKSLDIAAYPQAPSVGTPAEEMLGCVLDKLSFMLDGNIEPQITFSGPAQGLAGSSPSFTPQAQPGGFTTVGAENAIPSGISGYFQLGATLYQIEKMQIDIVNAMDLQNTALGTSKAVAYFRKGKRMVTVKIDAKASDDLTLWTPSLGSTSNASMIQIGSTASKMFGIYMPALIITTKPDTPNGDETNNWGFVGQALETSGNDEIFVAAA